MDNVTTEYFGQEQKKVKNHKWWLEDKDNLHLAVFSWVKQVEETQSYRKSRNLDFLRLYMNREIVGISSHTYAKTVSAGYSEGSFNRLTLNVSKSCTDSITSKVAKNRPRPYFLTTRGNRAQRNRAKKLTQYLDGAFDSADIYSKGQMAFVDACIFGTGCLQVFPDYANGKVDVDRIIIDEIVVDDIECFDGKPRQIHRKKLVSRDVLLAEYPEHSLKIEFTHPAEGVEQSAVSDLVEVVESWHLPSGPKAKDGKHTICVENCTLFEEMWTKDSFPFVFFRWNQNILGFHGTGLIEELVGIQLEINKIIQNIQKAQHLISVPRVYLSNQSKIVSSHIQNLIGGIVKYTGEPPIFQTPNAMPSEIYQHLERLYQKAYEITGISQLSATSQKPGGLNSGAALREYNDIESERFQVTGQRWEEFFMDLAEKFVECSKELYSEDKKLSVKIKGKKFIDKVKWSEVDLKDDQYSLRVYPTNLLPTQPSGRLEKVQELLASGLIAKEEALGLLDFPDIEKFITLSVASQEQIEKQIDAMLDDGTYDSPEPETNLALAIRMAHNAILEARLEEVDEANIELVQRYMAECRELEQVAMAQAQAQAQPQGEM